MTEKIVPGPFFSVASQVSGATLSSGDRISTAILAAAQPLADLLSAFVESDDGLIPDAEPDTLAYQSLVVMLRERAAVLERTVRRYFKCLSMPDCPIERIQINNLSLEQNAYCKVLLQCALEAIEMQALNPRIAVRIRTTTDALRRSLTTQHATPSAPPQQLCDQWIIQEWERGVLTIKEILRELSNKPAEWQGDVDSDEGMRSRINAAYKRAGRNKPRRKSGRPKTV